MEPDEMLEEAQRLLELARSCCARSIERRGNANPRIQALAGRPLETARRCADQLQNFADNNGDTIPNAELAAAAKTARDLITAAGEPT